MSRGPDAGTVLRRAIERDASRAGCAVSMSSAQATRWASATFIGAQHRLTLSATDDAALERWLGEIVDTDLPTRGHLIADIAVVAVVRSEGCAEITLEALTVEA